MGTATYFSPEQAQGYSVDNRSDVYSLGVVLYELATGRPPFSGENPVSVAYRHVSEIPVPPRQIDAAVPAAFEAVVLHAMSKDPDDRYANAEDLRTDLIRFRRGRPVSAPATDMTAAVVAADPNVTKVQARANATSAMTAVQPNVSAAGRRGPSNGTFVATLIAMLVVTGVLLYFLLKSIGFIGGTTATKVPVPNVIGSTKEIATATLEAAGFTVVVDEQNHAEPLGQVYDQDPKVGTSQDKKSGVTIRVSLGPKFVALPSVVGQDVSDAKATLEDLGLKVTIVPKESDEPVNRVLKQSPTANRNVEEGSTVELTVAAEKTKVAVPAVVGFDDNDANAAISKAGLVPRRAVEASDSVAEGKVIRTSPAAGTQVDKGTTVTFVVSSGPEQKPDVAVPNVVGDTEAQAMAKLTGAGFTVVKNEQTVFDPNKVGRVVSQSPSGGSTAPEGSQVAITVGVSP